MFPRRNLSSRLLLAAMLAGLIAATTGILVSWVLLAGGYGLALAAVLAWAADARRDLIDPRAEQPRDVPPRDR